MTREEKLLREDITKLEVKIKNVQDQIEKSKQAKNKYASQLNVAQQKLKNLDQPKNITISDHALVRYLERRMEIDIDTLRQQIITEQLQKVVEVVGGTGKFPVEGGTVVMESYTIVTFLPA